MFRVTAVCILGMTGLVFKVTAARFRVLRPSEQTPVAMFRVFRVTAARSRVLGL